MNISHLAPLVREHALRRQLAIYVLARLPSGMLILALLLHANSRLPALSGAGAVVAAYTVTVAVVAPLVGRIADRRGAQPVLLAAATVHLCGIAVIISSHTLFGLCIGALIAGAGLPPTPACLRAHWRQLPTATRSTVFAVDGIILESAHVVGPLIVSVLTAAFSPAVAVGAAAACTAVSAVLTAVILPADAHPGTSVRAHLAGPLRLPAVDLLLAVVALITAAIAIIEVSVVSYSSDHGRPALAGVLFAAMAGGSIIGGLLFATRGAKRSARELLPYLCLISAAGFALLTLAGSSAWLLFVLLALSNVAVSPAFALLFTFISDVAPENESAETFTWVSSSNFVAISAGTAIGGLLLTHTDLWVAYLVSVAVLLAAAALSVAAGRVAEQRIPTSTVDPD